MQKFLMAKAAGSSKGRAVIKDMLGEEGEALIDQIVAFVTKDAGKDKAQKVEKYICKVLAKVLVLMQNDKIKVSQFDDLSEPAKRFCWDLVDHCELSMVMLDSASLCEFVKKFASSLTEILKPHITGKTLQRVRFLAEYVGSEDTLRKLLQDDKFRDNKTSIANAIKDVLELLEIQKVDLTAIKDKDDKKEEKKAPAPAPAAAPAPGAPN